MRPVLIGRTAELERLGDAAGQALAGTGLIVVLEGEAGIGKRSLIQGLADRRPEFRFLRAACHYEGATPPFGPWREVVAQVHAQAEAGADPFTRALEGLSPIGGPSGAAEAVAACFAALGRPALVELSEFQWADPDSISLLGELRARVARLPVLVVLAHRPEELHRTHPLRVLRQSLEKANVKRLRLEGLSIGETIALVQAALPDRPGVVPLGLRLHRQTGGHPLFLLELLHGITIEGENPGEGAPPHEALSLLLEWRICRLPAVAQALLPAAALAGGHADTALLARVCDLEPEQVALGLSQAVQAGLLAQAEPVAAFVHGPAREAALSRLLLPQRRRLHLRVAEALMERPQPAAELLAYHLAVAGDPRAVTLLAESAARAARMGARTYATRACERALEILPPDDP